MEIEVKGSHFERDIILWGFTDTWRIRSATARSRRGWGAECAVRPHDAVVPSRMWWKRRWRDLWLVQRAMTEPGSFGGSNSCEDEVMTTKKVAASFLPEIRDQAVRLVLEGGGEDPTQWAARGGGSGPADKCWSRKSQHAGAEKPGVAASQQDPAQGRRVFCRGGARSPVADMIAFIDDHRQAHGVEPICTVLPTAATTCCAHAGRRADPGMLPAPARSDVALMAAIRRVHEANFGL